ncbi:hypothetical protein D3C71_1951210 [compost metagenome]
MVVRLDELHVRVGGEHVHQRGRFGAVERRADAEHIGVDAHAVFPGQREPALAELRGGALQARLHRADLLERL